MLQQQGGQDVDFDDAGRAEAVPAIRDGADSGGAIDDAHGEAHGVATANVRLGLRQTKLAEGPCWGLTSTTASDQLRLLSDLITSSSPLTAASRSYELRLMRHVESAQAWGASAAATPGTSPAVNTGLLPDPQLLVVNSIGVIPHADAVDDEELRVGKQPSVDRG